MGKYTGTPHFGADDISHRTEQRQAQGSLRIWKCLIFQQAVGYDAKTIDAVRQIYKILHRLGHQFIEKRSVCILQWHERPMIHMEMTLCTGCFGLDTGIKQHLHPVVSGSIVDFQLYIQLPGILL